MMENNWENFLKNMGEWRGSFTSISPDGTVLESQLSLLTLESFDNNQLVRFRLRRFGPGGYDEPPLSDHQQDYRTLGRQNIFFETGAFSKGSLQLAPFVEFGAEYGFVAENRRLRFVQLYDTQGDLSRLILIREFRQGSQSQERPPLTVEQLLGQWEGTACTAYSDWRSPETYSTHLTVQLAGKDCLQQQLSFGDRTLTSTARIEGNRLHFEEGASPRQILLLPDGASSNTPRHLTLRQAFFVEVGWLVEDHERQRLIRHYDEKGEWISATHVIEHRVG